MRILYVLFLLAFVAANLIVKHFGATGLIFSSFLLIPFDFICRCLIHEKKTGTELLSTLWWLTCAAGIITFVINRDALPIALASVAGFTGAQIAAGVVYQLYKKTGAGWFFKVNISDLFAVIVDSIIFQFIAFSSLNGMVLLGQICIKFTGGLLWYFIIFRTNIYKKIIK